MAALQVDTGRLIILAKFLLAAQAPFAATATFLHPADADAVSHFASGNPRAKFDNFADRFVPEHSGKLQRKQTVRQMNVGIAQATSMNFDDDLIGAGLGSFPTFYFPGSVDGGDYGGFHAEDLRTRVSSTVSWMPGHPEGCSRAGFADGLGQR